MRLRYDGGHEHRAHEECVQQYTDADHGADLGQDHQGKHAEHDEHRGEARDEQHRPERHAPAAGDAARGGQRGPVGLRAALALPAASGEGADGARGCALPVPARP